MTSRASLTPEEERAGWGVYHVYGSDGEYKYPPVHKKVRGWYDKVHRCAYCYCIPLEGQNKCEFCGAPL